MVDQKNKINVLHIVGGKKTNGVFKGAYILHEALLNLKVNSKILNDENINENNLTDYMNLINFNNSVYSNFLRNIFIFLEKIIKTIFLHSPRETFTLNFLVLF